MFFSQFRSFSACLVCRSCAKAYPAQITNVMPRRKSHYILHLKNAADCIILVLWR